ncbi:MAG: hypothetical protein OHK93_002384 [Ramalina farinacea]|uniref:Tyrosine specific protein phosphatases domain-containing protein n=1 Tax=Ramalina farinacea TaxID=258253 RepID=A0AA43U0B4_9LECA|nr:hypothetical protein [Ramalina farinacea]
MTEHPPSSLFETPLSSILNFRDVGKTINGLLPPGSPPMLRKGVLYRSARPDNASAADSELLSTVYDLKTIIDLRTETEHLEQAKKKGTKSDAFAQTATSDKIAERSINLNGGWFSVALIRKLNWGSRSKVLGLMATRHRLDAIKILGVEVMKPAGLIGMGKLTLESSHKEICEVLQVLAHHDSLPVLIHCTQGKDRTGLIIMLVLLLLDAPTDTITADYVASENQLEPEKEERMAELASMGLDESFAVCPANFVAELKCYIDDKYGGIENYLKECKVDASSMQAIRHNLLDR